MMEASAGQSSFREATEALNDAFGGAGSVIFELNRRTGEIRNWTSRSLRAGGDGYSDHLNAINPRMRFSLAHAPGHVAYEARFIDRGAIGRHEFYDWLYRSDGLRYFLGSRLYDDGDVSVMHSIEFTDRYGHPERPVIEAFARSSRALGNAWRAARATSRAEGRTVPSSWTPDHLPWAIFALATSGRVVQLNGRAEALLADGDALRLADGTIEAVDRAADEDLRDAVRRAVGGVNGSALLHRGPESHPLVVQAIPVNPMALAAPMGVAVVLYVRDPAQHARGGAQVLAELWKFTPAESQLLERIGGGSDLATAAATLGISRNTARNQLQSMFAKTGTRRQTELLALTGGLLGN